MNSEYDFLLSWNVKINVETKFLQETNLLKCGQAMKGLKCKVKF